MRYNYELPFRYEVDFLKYKIVLDCILTTCMHYIVYFNSDLPFSMGLWYRLRLSGCPDLQHRGFSRTVHEHECFQKDTHVLCGFGSWDFRVNWIFSSYT